MGLSFDSGEILGLLTRSTDPNASHDSTVELFRELIAPKLDQIHPVLAGDRPFDGYQELLAEDPHELIALNPDLVDFVALEKSPVEAELLQTEEFLRLSGIRQMDISYSGRGQNAVHTRYDHTLAVIATVDRLARQLELSSEETLLLRLGALFHDIGHGPMSHASEIFLASVSDVPFDHDEEGLDIIRNPPIRAILDRHEVDVEALCNILDDNYTGDSRSQLLRYLLKEVADRTAYLRMDSMALGLSPAAVRAIHKATLAYEQSVIVRNDWAYTDDEGAALAMMAARAVVFQEGPCHPSSELVRAAFIREGRKVIEDHPDLFDNHADISRMIDADLIRRFTPRLQQWLGPDLESSFDVVGAWRFSDLTEDGQGIVQLESFQDEIQQLLSSQCGIDPELVYVCYTDDFGKQKKISFLNKDDQVIKKKLTLRARPEHRFFFVAVGDDLPQELSRQAKELVSELMNTHSLKDPEAVSLGSRIFGTVDRSLYGPANKGKGSE